MVDFRIMKEDGKDERNFRTKRKKKNKLGVKGLNLTKLESPHRDIQI